MVIFITMQNNLGAWIKEGLSSKGQTQAWLAKQVGVQPPQISRIISGESEATPDILNRIADALLLPRAQAYRAAGHLTQVTDDEEWAELMMYKLNKIKKPFRSMAEKMISSIADAEDREAAPASKERKTTPVKP